MLPVSNVLFRQTSSDGRKQCSVFRRISRVRDERSATWRHPRRRPSSSQPQRRHVRDAHAGPAAVHVDALRGSCHDDLQLTGRPTGFALHRNILRPSGIWPVESPAPEHASAAVPPMGHNRFGSRTAGGVEIAPAFHPLRRLPGNSRRRCAGFHHPRIYASIKATKFTGSITMFGCGVPGNCMLCRAACAQLFPRPINVPEEAVYWPTNNDGGGHRLKGEHDYVMHFPSGGFPRNDAFWSLTMGDANNRFVANPLNRYSVSVAPV